LDIAITAFEFSDEHEDIVANEASPRDTKWGNISRLIYDTSFSLAKSGEKLFNFLQPENTAMLILINFSLSMGLKIPLTNIYEWTKSAIC